MNVSEFTQSLESRAQQKGHWRISIISFDDQSPPNIVEDPIYEVSIYPEDNKIHLLTIDADDPKKRPIEEALSVEALLARLQRLPLDHADFAVFYGSHFIVDNDWSGLENVPIVGVAENTEAETLGLLSWPPEQWGIESTS